MASYIDACDVADHIDTEDVARYFGEEDIAEHISVDVEDIEIDYEELAAHAVDNIDLEEVARHADVDKTIFSRIHMLQTKLDALIEVVNGSAMHTLDLMTFNKALQGEE